MISSSSAHLRRRAAGHAARHTARHRHFSAPLTEEARDAGPHTMAFLYDSRPRHRIALLATDDFL